MARNKTDAELKKAEELAHRQEQDALAKKASNIQRTSAIGSIYQTADRIITGRPITVTADARVGAAAAWTTGDGIVLNSARLNNLTDKALATMTGANFHELAHALFTPRGGSAIINHIRNTGHLEAFNILEDARIERLLVAQFPSMRGFLVHVVVEILVETGDMGRVYPLIAARGYLPQRLRQACRDAFLQPQHLDEIERITREFARLVFPTDSGAGILLIEEFAELMKTVSIPRTGCSYRDSEPHSSGKASSVAQQRQLQGQAQQQDANQAAQDAADAAQGQGDPSQGQGQSGQGGDDDGNGATGGGGAGTNSGVAKTGSLGWDAINPPDADQDAAAQAGATGGKADPTADADADADADAGAGDPDADADPNADPNDVWTDDDWDAEDLNDADLQAATEAAAKVAAANSVRNEALKAAKDAQSDVLKDKSVMENVSDTRRQLAKKMHVPSQIKDRKGGQHLAFKTNSLATARKVGGEVRRLIETHEAGWETEQASGRLNMARVMQGRDPHEVFDRWDQGEEGVSLETVVLIDSSGSMQGEQMTMACEAGAVLQRSMASAGVIMSTYTFNTELTTLYPRGDRPMRVRYVSADNYTHASPGLIEAYRVLHSSSANRKLVVLMTDGAFDDTDTSNDVITLMRREGITVAVCYVKTSYQSRYDQYPDDPFAQARYERENFGHGSDVFQPISSAADLVPFTREVVTQLLRRPAVINR